MTMPVLRTIPQLPGVTNSDYIYDDASGERQEYDYYSWSVGEGHARYFIYAALNHDIHPDPLERLDGKPLRFPSRATFAAFSNED